MTNHTFKNGVDRKQPSFLPPRVEDDVGRDNTVRAIDAYIGVLNLEELGFRQMVARASRRTTRRTC